MKTINKFIWAGIFLTTMFVLAFIVPNVVQAQYYTGFCSPHSSQRCDSGYLYWYDSCGNQQEMAQYCQNGCYNNSCQNYNNNYNNYNDYDDNGYNYNNNYNNYNNCTYHAYKLCVGNSVYWYNSCGVQQDLYSNCYAGQTCQYSQCVNYIAPIQPIQNYSNYIAHYTTACYGNSIHWYDSLGAESGLYKNCADNNNCTIDSCSANKCSNTLKCDGSTCAANSVDYNTYCLSKSTPASTPSSPANPTTQNSVPPTAANSTVGLSISFFEKQNSADNQWQKSAQIGPNSQVYFMISATNTLPTQIDNVNISANIPAEISSLGNLQLNGVSVSGDIVSGINIGSIAPATTKLVTFEGKTSAITTASTKNAVATSNVSGTTQTDSVSISLSPAQTTASVASAVSSSASSGFWGFLKKWYLWILVALVLIFIFIIVFRRLSSNV